MHCVDLTGKRFGKFTVIRRAGSDKNKKALWLCLCDCGTTKILNTTTLKSGNTQSCGCLKREMLIERNSKHGCSGTAEYEIWKSMIQRCHNPNNKAYPDYGGRGIAVCDRWRGEHGFENFDSDVGKRPADNMTLDRIDNNKGYSPDNCRWATRKEQANNKRNNIIVNVEGEDCTFVEGCEKMGVPEKRARSRVNKGMNPQKAIEKEDMSNTKYLDNDGEMKSYSASARANNVLPSTAFGRINRGMAPHDAVTTTDDLRGHYIETDRGRNTIKGSCDEIGVVTAEVAMRRIALGWDEEKAVTTPKKEPQMYPYLDKMLTIAQLAKVSNMKPATLRSRLNRGMSVEDALNTPVKKRK